MFFLFRLEEKKRQKKPEIKDPKLQELQERLEAKKAGMCHLYEAVVAIKQSGVVVDLLR